MIDVRELRVRDIVNNQYKINIRVSEIYAHGSVGIEGSDFLEPLPELSPINLTEDLLLKLDFKKEKHEILKIYEYNICINNHFIRINEYTNTLGKDYNIHVDNIVHDSCYSTDIQYLHQLQNAIYDATGEELDVTNILE